MRETLTDRQHEILWHITHGFSTPEIADILHLSVHTVDKHRRALATRLKARNVADLVRIAVERGLHLERR